MITTRFPNEEKASESGPLVNVSPRNVLTTLSSTKQGPSFSSTTTGSGVGRLVGRIPSCSLAGTRPSQSDSSSSHYSASSIVKCCIVCVLWTSQWVISFHSDRWHAAPDKIKGYDILGGCPQNLPMTLFIKLEALCRIRYDIAIRVM